MLLAAPASPGTGMSMALILLVTGTGFAFAGVGGGGGGGGLLPSTGAPRTDDPYMTAHKAAKEATVLDFIFFLVLKSKYIALTSKE